MPCLCSVDLAGACKSLVELSVSWVQGPHAHFLRFPDLAQGLSRHKHHLKKLVVDVSKVVYVYWGWCPLFGPEPGDDPDDPFEYDEELLDSTVSIDHALLFHPPGKAVLGRGDQPTYNGIGSLGDFLSLRHLEISVCVLGPFSIVDDLVGMLPANLESLVLLSPKQYGQPDIDDLVDGMLALGPSWMSRLKSVNGREVVSLSTGTWWTRGAETHHKGEVSKRK